MVGEGISGGVAALAIATMAACSAEPPTSVTRATLATCTPTQSAPVAAITDPNGPFSHQVLIAHTTDGLTISTGLQALVHASVPDGVRRGDGRVYVYYVDGARGAVWVARVTGDSAIPISAIAINGVSAPVGVVDPDALLQPDGRVRLTYLSGFGTPSATNLRAICIADSDDGVSFTVRAVAYSIPSGELITDPSVVRLAGGTWLMAMSLGNTTVLARSTDGLAFTREQTLSFGGVPELGIAPDGAVRLYVCAQGIVAYRSTNAGQTWTQERTVVTPSLGGQGIVCDPSLVAGTNYFIYKTA